MPIENYPLISEYEIEIRKFGSGILNLEDKYEFIPCRTTPIKIFNYGSGAFAGVFKVKNTSTGIEYALRCFLNGGNLQNINRSFQIAEYISQLEVSFLCKCKSFSEGINIKGTYYPVILMEWIQGKKLNDYVSSILDNSIKINLLQEKLVNLSHNLETLNIAHGDIQSGNILVQEIDEDIQLKLVDYDPMFIPTLQGKMANELGHSSFQHPKRSKKDYDAHIDRFSFWLLLTAIEAIKYDKTLWNKDLNGGFNDEDNFLFKAQDLQYPRNSALVRRLKGLQQPSVNFYLQQLLGDSFSTKRETIRLFDVIEYTTYIISTQNNPILTEETIIKTQETEQTKEPLQTINPKETYTGNHFLINSTPTGAKVYIGHITEANFKGCTPLELPLSYQSQKIILDYLGLEKAFYLSKNELYYNISLGKNTSYTGTTYKVTQTINNSSYNSNYFTIDSIPQGAEVYINDLYRYEGTTPLELDFKHQGHKIILIYNEKQKTFYLNKDQLHYQIDLEQNQNYIPPKTPIQTPTTEFVNNYKDEGNSYSGIVIVIIIIINTILFYLLWWINQ
nr:PEGA domain-containing protein [uncultured Capnocytophaga sp.]